MSFIFRTFLFFRSGYKGCQLCLCCRLWLTLQNMFKCSVILTCSEALQSERFMRDQLRSFLSNLRIPNAEVWKQLTKIRFKRSNIPTECWSKSSSENFIQDLFWRVSFSNEDIKTVEEGLASLGDRQYLNLSVPGSRCCSKY